MREVGLIFEPKQERAALMYQRMNEAVRQNIIWAPTPREAIDVLETYNKELMFVSLGAVTDEEVLIHEKSEHSHMEIIRYLQKADPADFNHCVFYLHSHDERVLMIMQDRLRNYKVKVKPFGS